MPNNILRGACIVVGEPTSGKSAVTQVFHSDGSHFPKSYLMTVGVELCTKTVNVPETNDAVELFIYDSAGKELFYDHVQKHWDHPSMVMVVYDVTSETSFNSCAKWLERVRSHNHDVSIPGVLVANKIDLDQRRVISPKSGKEFAESNGLEYFECSAKEMQNVDQPFHYLAKQYYRLYQEKIEYFKSLA
ncbi:hypothetical protein LSH36_34g00049 [Paralvinella palmiformis]|uniref:Intraflagellar transport protein 27 homolog n=1 Tax=Paralvinella palmiformis TaxID=53620 RepID=A0AAD9K8S4_9ANNE|nr:hypothetical protein LSH36_34g00049 [Paralvinella palmiformis]